jgi:hypothetical protein
LHEDPAGGAVVNAQSSSSPVTPVFQFHALAGLPCGCVAAAYRSVEWAVAMVSIEARGPHCVFLGHEVGRTLELHDLFDDESFEDTAPEQATLARSDPA